MDPHHVVIIVLTLFALIQTARASYYSGCTSREESKEVKWLRERVVDLEEKLFSCIPEEDEQ